MRSKEIGRIGQRRYGGTFYEEFLPELRGRRGIETYREMSENDDVVGAILFAVEMLVRQCDWNVEPGGDTAVDREAAEFVRGCMDDMQETWIDTISEILSFITYGWSFHEIVYKRRMGNTKDPRTRSKYSDGLVGWRKLPVRAQETLHRWEYDSEDNLLGMTQMPPPDYREYTIPVEKALLFRTKSRKDSPEGRSILRNAYRSWYFKRRIQEIEGIGIERDLAGLPVITAPEELDIWNREDAEMVKTYAYLQGMVRDTRRDELEGLVLPYGFGFSLVSTGGSRQFDTNAIINRYDTRIAMTVLADFIFLGHDRTGSWALSSDKTELFAVAIGTFLDIICETFDNQGIPALIDINGGHFAGITQYPKMTHGDIEDADIAKVAAFIKDMTGIGVLIPDDGLEDYIRQVGHLPERTYDARKPDRARQEQQEKEQPPEPETAAGTEELDDEEKKVEAAKRRLGRVQKFRMAEYAAALYENNPKEFEKNMKRSQEAWDEFEKSMKSIMSEKVWKKYMEKYQEKLYGIPDDCPKEGKESKDRERQGSPPQA